MANRLLKKPTKPKHNWVKGFVLDKPIDDLEHSQKSAGAQIRDMCRKGKNLGRVK